MNKFTKRIISVLEESDFKTNALYLKMLYDYGFDKQGYNWWNFKKALEGLIKRGFIECNKIEGLRSYSLTSKGQEYLNVIGLSGLNEPNIKNNS